MSRDLLKMPGDISMEEALVSDNPISRGIARLQESKMGREMTKVIRAEMTRPDFDVQVFAHSLGYYFMNIHASFAACAVDPASYPALADMLKIMIDRDYVNHANEARTILEGGSA